MTKTFLCAALLAACTSASSTGITSANLSCDSSLTYANFGSAFIQTNCLSCHATKEQPTLSTQAQILANSSRILEQAVYTTAMPQDTNISNAERQMLGDWLQCGAP
ncbi:MAG: hypothetical protein JO257_21440 [Deltaproteobacteria bacterium]|nr:hypothetical protein [Deltaproteobacteria bacterium]